MVGAGDDVGEEPSEAVGSGEDGTAAGDWLAPELGEAAPPGFGVPGAEPVVAADVGAGDPAADDPAVDGVAPASPASV